MTDQERDIPRAFGALSGTGFERRVEQVRRELRKEIDERIERMEQ